ncbi:hypothetical protein [Micromonospora sp. NPDC003241]
MGEQPQEWVPGAGHPHEPRLGTVHRDRPGGGGAEPAGAEPDVLLDVPRVSVDSIRLSVDGLDADLSLRARVAGLLEVDAGARVHLEGVDLDVTGAQAQALLKVRLEKLVTILDRALTTIDHNPQVIDAPRPSGGAEQRPGPPDRPSAPVSGPPTGRPGRRVGDPGGEPPGRPGGAPIGSAGGQVGGPTVGQATDRAGGSPVGRGAGPQGQAVGRTADGVGGAPDPGIGPPGGATDDLGQQVGAIGAVADSAPGGAGPDRGGPQNGQRDRAEKEPEARRATPSGPEPSTARQLAEQTGESILHAGRSVWDAIQNGLAQRRQDD